MSMLHRIFCCRNCLIRPFESPLLLFLLLVISVGFPLLSVLPSQAGDYTIGAGDVLSVTVYDHEELTTKVRVSENGRIDFPLIGSVRVGGRKVSSAAGKIEKLLADGYIVDPQVTIFIEQFKSKKVIVLGRVKNPGLIELRGPTSLLELISQAGGLQKDAGETATIKREVNGKQKVITVDLQELIDPGDPEKNIQILGGDTVSIAQGAVCYITGEVKRPGAYPCDRNATVLKLISLAGSFTDKALESAVRINRVVNGKKRVLKNVDHDLPVQPDDVIIVPERVNEKKSVCYITGQVNKPGAYPCGPDTTVLKMVSLAGSFTGIASESRIRIKRVVKGKKKVLKKVDLDTSVQPDDVIVVPESFF